ncbi:hypothetical protein AB0880_25555 [Micromonospora chersina]|uniref:hypothetical protein n=1 Tax=Micromonospora chersina TaxID=47854 RepID=UPI003456F661
MNNRDLEELIRAGRNIQALVLIREKLGCGLVEAIDVLDGHHQRLKAEQPIEQPNQRPPADGDGPGHQVGQWDQAVDQRRATDS